MVRDKHKDRQYFSRKNEFLFKGIDTFLDTAKIVKEEQRGTVELSLSHFYENLFKSTYSFGEDVNNIFDYYLKALGYYKNKVDDNSSLYDIIDYFAIGVLYSDRKAEFIDDLKVLYDNLIYTDDLIDYYATYLFHDKIVPYRSVLEYQNMIGDDFDSVQKAQGFWYYEHSDAPWYETHHYDNRGYYGYWAFDTAATCKIKGIFDERLKNLDYFPYDLLVQKQQ